MKWHQNNNHSLTHWNFSVGVGVDGVTVSPMSPDEEVIRQRGQIRTSPRKRAFQTSTPTITDVGKATHTMYIHTVLVKPWINACQIISVDLFIAFLGTGGGYLFSTQRSAQLVSRWCIGSALSIGDSLIIIWSLTMDLMYLQNAMFVDFEKTVAAL